MAPRAGLAFGLVLLLVGLVAWGRWQRQQQAKTPATAGQPLSHARCAECHAEVAAEWQQSFHSRAWSDANVQAAFRHFGHDRKCESCHAPEPVLLRGITEPVDVRRQDLESGVNCLSCHQTADGRGVAARRTISDAPCRPVATASLTTSQFCGACHTSDYQDWHESVYRTENRSCQDCHMPPVSSRPGGRSHVCLGGHDPATVRSGARMECRQEDDQLVVAVTNHASGHNFPGERHNRILLVQVIQRNQAGEIVLARQHVIKAIVPFRGESSADMIPPKQTYRALFPVEEPGVAEVQLLYKSFPWHSDREALVVHEASVEIRQPARAQEKGSEK